MFDQTFVDTQTRANRPWSMAASLTVQTGAVGMLLLIPLLHPEGPFMKVEAPPLIYRANVLTPDPIAPVIAQRSVASPRAVFRPSISAPTSIPKGVPHIEDAPDVGPQTAMIGAIPGGGNVDRLFGGVGERLPAAPPKALPNVEKPAPPSAPLRVSSTVQGALLKFGPKPAYPPLAKAARIQGTVRLTAVVGADGAIRNLRLISGPPLLVKAAVDAVSTWRYQPTLLNGSPIDVITEIDVNFTLSN
jgi:protein TonB